MTSEYTYDNHPMTEDSKIEKGSFLYAYHAIFWATFIAYETITSSIAKGSFGNPLSHALHYSLNIFLFYVNALVTLPTIHKIGKKHANLFVPLAIGLEIISFLITAVILDSLQSLLPNPIGLNAFKLDLKYFAGGMWRATYFLLWSTGYYYVEKYFWEVKENADLRAEKLEMSLREKDILLALESSKNAYLHAQINPHFLFNALNFIFSQVHRHDQKTAMAVQLLARIMRYATDAGQNSLYRTLGSEITQIKNLISLFQLQHRDNANLRIQYHDEILEKRFLSLILLTLFENMIKHGDLSEANHPAIMEITIVDNSITIITRNLIGPPQPTASSGVGLQNIRRRLEFAYGTNVRFLTQTSSDNYFISKTQVSLLTEAGSKDYTSKS